MRPGIARRLSVWVPVLRPGWRWLFVLPTTFFGTCTLIRDEFLPIDHQAELGTRSMLSNLPQWAWQTWALITAIIIVFFILEGAYREQEKLKRRFGVEGSSALPLSIEFRAISAALDGQGSHYNVTSVLPDAQGKQIDAITIVREIRVGIVNNSSKTIDDVSLHVRTLGQGAPRRQQNHRSIWRRPKVETIRYISTVLDIPLPRARDGLTSISLGPKRTEWISLISLAERGDAPMPGQFAVKDSDFIDMLGRIADDNFAALGWLVPGYKILKNSNIELQVELTGRDVPPVYGRFYLNLRNAFSCEFEEAESID
jgi:hypothetical protein